MNIHQPFSSYQYVELGRSDNSVQNLTQAKKSESQPHVSTALWDYYETLLSAWIGCSGVPLGAVCVRGVLSLRRVSSGFCLVF